MSEFFVIIGAIKLAWGVPFVTILAVALIVVSSSQLASLSIASRRMAISARRRRQFDLRRLRQAAEFSRLKSELQSSVNGTSVAWRIMEVAKVVDESADCRSYYLMDVYRQPLPMFRPGQHILVRPAMAGAYQTTRCYSLSAAPDARFWRITVKRQWPNETPLDATRAGESSLPSAQRPEHHHENRPEHRPEHRPGKRLTLRQPGGLSGWLHDSVATGDCLLVGGPSGHFFLSHDNSRTLVLLAAGVGITPLASMVLWSQHKFPQRPIRLLYQAQSIRHWPLGWQLHRSLSQLADGQATSYFSRATRGELEPLASRLPGELWLGKFSADDALQATQGRDCDFFLCGPDAWMDALRTGLRQAGVESDRIHWESFGSSALPDGQSQSHTQSRLATPLDVQFERSGVQAQWSDTQQSLWDLARQHQVDIPSGCLSGACGGCRVKLLQGQVVHARPVAIDLADDECLACIARPATACSIDV